jgi:hypothetical protein
LGQNENVKLAHTFTYFAKWLSTKHLKEVHGLMAEKAKPRRFSTFEKSLLHQDHAKMNTCILGNAMAMQKGMIKRLLIMFMPKSNANGIN